MNRWLRHSLAGYMTLPDEAYVVAPQLGGDAGPLGSIILGLVAEQSAPRLAVIAASE